VKFLEELQAASPVAVKELLKGRFAKNQSFFKRKEKKLYDYLTIRPIQFGLVADNRGINILNLSTNTLVYPTDEDGRHTAIGVSMEMAANPLSHTKWQVGFEQNPFYMISSTLAFSAEVSRNIFGFAYSNGMRAESFGALDAHLTAAVLYGLGGGFVLEAMLERYESIGSLFIYEPLPEFFGISAYFVDYEELFSRVGHLMLCVGEPPSSLKIREFFGSNRFGSLYPRLELTMYDMPQMQLVKNSVRVEAGSLLHGFGSYEDEMIGWRNSQKNCSFKNIKYPVLKKIKKKLDFPICVVGNGGSLDERIEWLKANQEKMIIFSAGTALRTLLKNGVRPDFQIEIERTDYLGGILEEAGAKDIDMIAANVVDPKTLEASKAERFIFFRDYTAVSYLDEPMFFLSNSSPFVGNAAFSLAATFSKSVILCGMDVGYKRGRTIHSKDSIYKEDEELPPGSVRVKANFEESEIYSNHLFGLSRSVLEFAAAKHSDTKAVNISDGVWIAGIEPCIKPNLGGGDKQKAKTVIKSSFSQKRDEVLKRDGLKSIEGEIGAFRNELFAIFAQKVKSRSEFYERVLIFEGFLAYKEAQKAVLFFLFGGTLKHIVFSMYVCVYHTETDNFELFYDGLCGRFFEGFDKIVGEFQKELAKGRVSDLLGGIKI
jgi:hypothetical protein